MQISNLSQTSNLTQRVTAALVTELLSEEMVNEYKPKRKKPGIIARLMGFDGLLAQRSVHKQQKGLIDNSDSKTMPIESHRNAISYVSYHHRKISNESKQFKDFSEVIEAPKMEKNRNLLQSATNEKCFEAKLELIQKKFLDVQRYYTVERLQKSNELQKALEVLDSYTDLLLKILPNFDSLCTTDPYEVNGGPSQPHSTQIAVIRPTNALKCEKQVEMTKRGTQASRKGDISSQKYRNGGFTHPHSRSVVQSSLKSQFQLKGRDKMDTLPTRIVVLKPSIGKSHNATKHISSPHSTHGFVTDYENHAECLDMGDRESILESSNLCNHIEPSRYRFRESREVANDITRRARSSFVNNLISLSPSCRRGYVGDESLNSMSENDFLNEPDSSTLTSGKVFDRNNPYVPSSHLVETSVNRKVKTSLSKKLKLNRRFLNVCMVNRGNTLSKMFSVPARKTLTNQLDGITGQENSSGKDKIYELNAPLDISRMDRWSGIVNIPSAALGSPRLIMGCESTVNYTNMVPKENLIKGRNNEIQINYNQQDLGCRNLRAAEKEQLNLLSEEASVVSPESDSSISSKDTDQPSPVSVLKACFVETTSSGHRMQHQLLKSESEPYPEDKIIEEIETSGAEEKWEYSYLIEVLNQCNFDFTDPGTYMASWNTLDHLISPAIFENLEKNYVAQGIGLQYERKLLFDRINLSAIDMFKIYMDVHPWVNPTSRMVRPMWNKIQLESEMWKLLEGQENKWVCNEPEIVVEKKSRWLDIEEEVNVIGEEVGGLLFDEIVMEIVAALRF